MEQIIKSEALKVNLEATRSVEINIPKEYLEFIELSKSHWGIHKRAEKCIREYHHPYSNHNFVAEQLRQIALSDFWFYLELENAGDAFAIIAKSLGSLLSADINDKLKESILRTLLEFIDRLFDHPDKLEAVGHECILIFEENFKNNLECFIRSSSYFKKHLNKGAQFPEFKNEIFSITKKIFESTIAFWNETTRIEQWYREKQSIFRVDYSDVIGSLGDSYFSNLREKLASATTFNELIENIPSFTDITNQLRQLTVNFDAFIEKFYYTFYLLYLPGMSGQKDRLLRDINFFLAKIVSEIDLNKVFDFLDMIFEMFQEFRNDHASPVLDCISTLGKKIIDLDDSDDKFRVNYFEKKLINFGFEFPGIVYVDEDWKTHVNENHLKNIRVWVEILKYASSIPEKLLSALIVNLRLGGVYISDTDLFQRDITNILNSNIAPFYKKVKQLSYIFPVYFNEIGAEGEIRQVTTSIDELSQRNDRLIHFLRKQVHIEGNNKLIDLTQKIFNFWYDGRLEALEQTFPQDVYESIDINGRWFVGIHQIVKAVCEKQDCRPEKFLDLEESELDKILGDISDKNETDKKRFKYICRLYRLLREKYSFDTVDIISILQKSNFLDNQEIDKFKTCLANQSYSAALKMVFKFMGQLKEIILDPVQTEGWENIYYKRHVAFGIPSMYGVYREKKFEAMGLIFRLERLASRLIDEIIDKTNLHYISATTLRHIFKVLKLFQEGMELDGISNQEFNSNIQMFKHSLTSATFSLSQYTNIFEFMAESIREIISEYFIRSYEYPLNIIIPQLFFCDKDISEKEKNTTCLKKSEEFNRDMIANCFFLQRLDNFISSILNTLHNMVDNYGPEIINNIMSYNSHLVVSPFYKKTNLVDSKIFLGEKGYFLKKLFLAGVPVPQGFVITTEVFRRRNAIYKHPHLNEELDNIILKHVNELGEKSGRRYGDPRNPLLLSVRAGGAMSMPGAMDTFTNVGMNDEIAEQLSLRPGFAWASWDSYRRFLQNWGMAHDIHRDVFDKVISDFKQKYSIKFKSDLTPEQMRQIAIAYKKVLKDRNVQFEQDPMLQLKKTILAVFDSWSSKRARVYREHLRVSDEWGTAVIVQKMVYGNLNKRSGSGVLFTHNPKRGRPGVHLFGDFALCSQGEDIVSGLVHAMPVGKTQRKQLKLSTISLQEAFPDIYKRIYDIAKDIIENYGFSHQEIEFTFESENPEDLYILQARNQNIKPDKHINVFNYPKEEMNFVGRGIGIGGGALNGVLVFDDEDLKYFPEKNPDTYAILARPDTVPDDIGMIFKCDGLITARGGVTSHAAVTATKIGKVCVVNCTDMIVNELKKELVIKGNVLKAGDEIAIDGNLGYIYRGHYPIENTEIVYDRINKY